MSGCIEVELVEKQRPAKKVLYNNVIMIFYCRNTIMS